MRKLLCLILLLIPAGAFAAGPVYQNPDPTTQKEFILLYQQLKQIQSAFPSGTSIVFISSGCPDGWTQNTDFNDRAVRISSTATGGSTGGSASVSAGIPHTHTITSGGAHTHTVAHTHGISSAAIDHRHLTPDVYDSNTGEAFGNASNPFGHGGNASSYNIGTQAALIGPQTNKEFQKSDVMTDFAAGDTDSETPTTSSNGAHDHGAATGSGSAAIAYVDGIVCTKN